MIDEQSSASEHDCASDRSAIGAGACGVVVSTLATHASGPGSIPVAGGQKERLISLLLNIRGCAYHIVYVE